MQKKNIVITAALWLGIVVCTCLIMIRLNNTFPALHSGDQIDSRITDTVYTLKLEGASPVSLVFPSETAVDDLTLLIVKSSPNQITLNGAPVENDSASYRRPVAVAITGQFYDPIQKVYRITLAIDSLPSKVQFYLGLGNQLQKAISAFDFLTTLSLGVLIGMLINGLSLCLFKPSEHYIKVFCFYLLILLIWTLGSSSLQLPAVLRSIYGSISAYMYTLLMISGSLLCLQIYASDPGFWIRRLFHPVVIVGVCVLLDFSKFILSNDVLEIMKFSFSLIGAAAVIAAAARKEKLSFLLLAAYAVTEGLRLLPQLADKGVFQESLMMTRFRAAHIFDMPFAFLCLVLINYRFAEAFKKSEKQAGLLEEMNQQLDQKVEQRTHELIEAETTRHNLMTNVFHDLRSPLFVLRGYFTILKAGDGNEETYSVIDDRLNYLTRLVEDLFLIAKLEDKKVLFNFTRVEFCLVVQDLVASCALEAQEKQIVLRPQLQSHVECWADPVRIRQAISNLLQNALLYTPPEGTITVTLTVDTKVCVLKIADTGKGIPPADLDKIFTKYYRVQGNGNKKSTGLGLSIAQEIIVQHHGEITVESQLGRGSVFTIRLPVLPDQFETVRPSE